MLIAALIFFIALSIMLGVFLNYAAAEINRLELRIITGNGQTDYWMAQTENYRHRYIRCRDGLKAIQNMQTDGMANIGRRMVIVAAQAQTEASEMPFNKD